MRSRTSSESHWSRRSFKSHLETDTCSSPPTNSNMHFKGELGLTLACDRMAAAWASWADTAGPLSPPLWPKRNCNNKVNKAALSFFTKQWWGARATSYMNMYHSSWHNYCKVMSKQFLTGSMTEDPGGPGTPSAPGSPGLPGGPCREDVGGPFI